MSANILAIVLFVIWILGFVPIGYEVRNNFERFSKTIESQQASETSLP